MAPTVEASGRKFKNRSNKRWLLSEKEGDRFGENSQITTLREFSTFHESDYGQNSLFLFAAKEGDDANKISVITYIEQNTK